MKKHFAWFVLWIAVGFGPTAFAQQTPDLKKLDAYFAKAQKDWGVPGMSIGIVKDGQVVFAKGYGALAQGSSQRPDDKSLYAIASNSKAFTSAILGMLVQEGKLSWDDKVRKHLPYFELYNDYVSNETTIRDLLSHRVGLATFGGDIIWYNSNLTSEQIIRRVKHLKSVYDFRAGYGYSNVMFITAGEIIQKVTGKTWYQNVKERILDPLGMTRTLVNIPTVEKMSNVAMPHAHIDNKVHQPIPYTSWEEIAATGGLVSCVDDLNKWMIFNLNNGIWKSDTLLKPQTRNAVWAPHNIFPINRFTAADNGVNWAGYGLGWVLRDYFGNFRVGHTGGYDGMITSVTMLPNQKLGVVVLTNGLKAPIGALPNYVFDAFLGRPEKDWSALDLERTNKGEKEDTRIEDLRKARQANTKPSVEAKSLVGTYYTPAYGNITVSQTKAGQLEIDFEHTPNLSATLSHWHHDTYEMTFKKSHPWFTLALVKFTTDASQKVNGIEFTVPNNDFWFEEINAKRVERK